ncbi:MAG: hypothetical protein J5825_12195 [Lachnospiraceae bacterium]|nr:hypothetical protein [Lachnospiraceae bacterium]
MLYDPNYRAQFFWQENGPIEFDNVAKIMKGEMANFKKLGSKKSLPLNYVAKLIFAGAFFCAIAVGAVTLISYLKMKSPALTVVVLIIGTMVTMGILLLLGTIAMYVLLPMRCRDRVQATVIGYSVSLGGGGRYNMKMYMRSPVFQYDYRGKSYTAFDGMHDNFGHLPEIGSVMTIRVNPAKPEELLWIRKKELLGFLILTTVVSFAAAGAFIGLMQVDEGFRNQVLGDKNGTGISGEKDPGTGKKEGGPQSISDLEQTADGRRILTDEFFENMIKAQNVESDWKVGVRKLLDVTTGDDGSRSYIFEDDPNFAYQGVRVKKENLSEAEEKATVGDEYYYIEIGDHGSNIYPCAEYVYEGEKLVK